MIGAVATMTSHNDTIHAYIEVIVRAVAAIYMAKRY